MNRMQFALAGMVILAGCGGERGIQEQTGQIELSLIGQAASGATYRLRDGIVMVQGPEDTLFFNTEEDPGRRSLSAEVTAGGYFAFLQEGWRLERLTEGKAFETVAAQLTSPNPLEFDVYADERTTVALRFLVGGDTIEFGRGAFDIVLEIDEQPTGPGSALCAADSDCAAGETCCLGGFMGTCVRLDPGATCPLPDLTISAESAQASMMINHEIFPVDSCAIVEGCVGGAGDRRLLRFSTLTPNVGEADMILGDPTVASGGFEYSACHNHHHFEGYARYELLDGTGSVVATGHKQAFCLLDSWPVTEDAPPSSRYHCGFQGIQRGWSDIYDASLDCQWVDITGVVPGEYLLRISINPDRTLPESDYANNTVEVPVTIPEDGAPVDPEQPGDPLAPCGPSGVGMERDCGWSIADGFEGAACTPGEQISVGCGCACVEDPMIRVCDGASGCTAREALSQDDDACGLCPQASFVCPASGVYTVLVGAYDLSFPSTCDVATVSP